MNRNDLPPPKIEFPCPNYPIKVIGEASEDFSQMVIAVMQQHVEDFDPSTLTRRDSSNGRFHAVQVLITATGPLQLEAINSALRATGRVHMVL